MAKLSIIICDLCKKINEAKEEYLLTIQVGKGKDREVTKAEICSTCYEKLSDAINSEFEFNKLPQQQNSPGIEIGRGENIVPSNINNVAPPPQLQVDKCKHDSRSLTPVGETTWFVCRDCGHEWEDK